MGKKEEGYVLAVDCGTQSIRGGDRMQITIGITGPHITKSTSKYFPV